LIPLINSLGNYGDYLEKGTYGTGKESCWCYLGDLNRNVKNHRRKEAESDIKKAQNILYPRKPSGSMHVVPELNRGFTLETRKLIWIGPVGMTIIQAGEPTSLAGR
jgi:hypothetical protein